MYVRQESLRTLVTPEMEPALQELHEQWQSVSYEDVVTATNDAQTVDATDRTSRAIILEPENAELDDSRSLVLSLPYLNGWNPQHFIRARVMQQIVAPNNRVIVLPNNAYKQKNYDLAHLSEHDQANLHGGRMKPFGEQVMRTLEHVDTKMRLGSIALTGYSFGARAMISAAAVGSSKLNVSHVNADEAPSKVHRSAAQLRSDFLRSGGVPDIIRSAHESGIPALDSVIKPQRLTRDLMRFGLMTRTKHGRQMHHAMTDSLGMDMFTLSLSKDIAIKIGYVEDSLLFDPDCMSPNIRSGVDIVRYYGPGFRAHASGDNVINHALMVRDGLTTG